MLQPSIFYMTLIRFSRGMVSREVKEVVYMYEQRMSSLQRENDILRNRLGDDQRPSTTSEVQTSFEFQYPLAGFDKNDESSVDPDEEKVVEKIRRKSENEISFERLKNSLLEEIKVRTYYKQSYYFFFNCDFCFNQLTLNLNFVVINQTLNDR
jgi:hypothetical protein